MFIHNDGPLLTLVVSPLGRFSECSSPRLIVFSVVLMPKVLLKFRVPELPSVTTTEGCDVVAVCLLNQPMSAIKIQLPSDLSIWHLIM